MRKKLIKYAFLAALGEGIYIFLVALFMKYASQLFGPPDPNFFGIIVFLMLFVLSAAVSGVLVLGKPILMYLDGRKKEAIQLFGFTIFWLFIFFVLTLISLVTFR